MRAEVHELILIVLVALERWVGVERAQKVGRVELRHVEVAHPNQGPDQAAVLGLHDVELLRLDGVRIRPLAWPHARDALRVGHVRRDINANKMLSHKRVDERIGRELDPVRAALHVGAESACASSVRT